MLILINININNINKYNDRNININNINKYNKNNNNINNIINNN